MTITARPSINGSRRFAEGTGTSSATQRMRSAAVRALDACRSHEHAATRLAEELEDVTSPHGIAVTGLSEEDSLVTAVADLIQGGATAKVG